MQGDSSKKPGGEDTPRTASSHVEMLAADTRRNIEELDERIARDKRLLSHSYANRRYYEKQLRFFERLVEIASTDEELAALWSEVGNEPPHRMW